jgi:hypothetical protein
MKHPPRPVRLAALVRPDQKAWLQSQVTPLRSLADVVRDLIDAAIQREREQRS